MCLALCVLRHSEWLHSPYGVVQFFSRCASDPCLVNDTSHFSALFPSRRRRPLGGRGVLHCGHEGIDSLQTNKFRSQFLPTSLAPLSARASRCRPVRLRRVLCVRLRVGARASSVPSACGRLFVCLFAALADGLAEGVNW